MSDPITQAKATFDPLADMVDVRTRTRIPSEWLQSLLDPSDEILRRLDEIRATIARATVRAVLKDPRWFDDFRANMIAAMGGAIEGARRAALIDGDAP